MHVCMYAYSYHEPLDTDDVFAVTSTIYMRFFMCCVCVCVHVCHACKGLVILDGSDKVAAAVKDVKNDITLFPCSFTPEEAHSLESVVCCGRGIKELMVEGGPFTARAFLSEKLVDRASKFPLLALGLCMHVHTDANFVTLYLSSSYTCARGFRARTSSVRNNRQTACRSRPQTNWAARSVGRGCDEPVAARWSAMAKH